MPTVELRDIVTAEDRAAALALERRPGDERFVASVEESFKDADKTPTPRRAHGRCTTAIGSSGS